MLRDSVGGGPSEAVLAARTPPARRRLRTVVLATVVVLLTIAGAPTAASVAGHAPLMVSQGSELLRYEGRWHVGDAAATTVNSGSRIFLRFHGGEVTGAFDLAGIEYPPRIYAYVDGVRSEPLVVDRERIRLTPVGLPRGEHELVLVVKDVDERGNGGSLHWRPRCGSRASRSPRVRR